MSEVEQDPALQAAYRAMSDNLGSDEFTISIWSAAKNGIEAYLAASQQQGPEIKGLEWSQSRVFGRIKRRGFSPFGEWTAFIVDDLTPEQIAAKEAAAQADYEARIRTALAPSVGAEEPARCFICDQPLLAGQLVLQDVSEGLGHRACFGDDREGFVKNIDTGEPLDADAPLPAGFLYVPNAEPSDDHPMLQMGEDSRGPKTRAPSPHKGEPGDDGKPLPYAWAWWGKDEASMWPVWSIGATRPTEAPLDAVALYATPQAPIPEGMVLVPRKLTEAMKQAGMDVLMYGSDIYATDGGQIVIETTTPGDIYRAMLAAATPAPQAEPGAGE